MSKVQLPLHEANILADKVVEMLTPYCGRIQVAGSIRRQRPQVGDIEIVCIPLMQSDLFGNLRASLLSPYLEVLAQEGQILKGDRWGPKYKKLHLPAMPELSIDLFITTPDEWGYTFTIRTGDKDFSRLCVTPKQQGGFLPSGLRVAECRLWQDGEVLDTSEELLFLEALQMGWIKPEYRGGSCQLCGETVTLLKKLGNKKVCEVCWSEQ